VRRAAAQAGRRIVGFMPDLARRSPGAAVGVIFGAAVISGGACFAARRLVAPAGLRAPIASLGA